MSGIFRKMFFSLPAFLFAITVFSVPVFAGEETEIIDHDIKDFAGVSQDNPLVLNDNPGEKRKKEAIKAGAKDIVNSKEASLAGATLPVRSSDKKKEDLLRLKKVKAKVSVNYVEVPLADIVREFSEYLDYNFVIDAKVDKQQLVTFEAVDMEWRNVFKWVMRLCELKCVSRDEALYIVNKDWEDEKKLVVLPMGDLLRELEDFYPTRRSKRKVRNIGDDNDDDDNDD